MYNTTTLHLEGIHRNIEEVNRIMREKRVNPVYPSQNLSLNSNDKNPKMYYNKNKSLKINKDLGNLMDIAI